jgi:hypothetical protein
MPEISPKTKKLINSYQHWFNSLQSKEKATIKVDEVISRMAVFYEKLREVVDWREEHLMRKSAIERNLKRRLFLLNDKNKIAEPLILELVRGGHFPNEKIPESKIKEVDKIIGKYLYIIKKASRSQKRKAKKQQFRFNDWLIEIAACEIEEKLSPPLREKALIDFMTELMSEKIKLSGKATEITQEEKYKQVYIATQKALFKLDPPIIRYSILKKEIPQWKDLTEESQKLIEITKNIFQIRENIEKSLNHPLSHKFYKICEKYDTLYLILGDIISEKTWQAEEIIKQPEILESKIGEAYSRRLGKLNSKIKRAAIYATLSIFITKILLALAIEMPLDKYITQDFNYLSLGLNIVIPPLLMLSFVLTISPPGKENLYRVIMELTKIVYQPNKEDSYLLESPQKRGKITNFLIKSFYFLTFFFVFGLIIWGLYQINFSIFSILIFLLFVSLISFTGVKLRERSRELDILERKDSFLMFFFDIFAIPIVRVGKWLSSQWTKYNIIVALINLLIELPLQTFMGFLEQWRSFLKEKKEEIH